MRPLSTTLTSTLRSASVFLSGNVVYIVTQFLMLVVLARFTTPTEVGRYALALAIAAPVFSLASLKLREVQISDAAGVNSPAEFFRLRLLSTAVSALVLLGVGLFLPRETAWILLSVTVFKGVEASLEIVYGTLQRHQLFALVARFQAVRGAAGLALFAGVVVSGGPTTLAILASAAPTGLCILWADARLRAAGITTHGRARWSSLKVLALRSAPLGVAVALGSLLAAVPRYALDLFATTADVGIFAALAYFLIAPATVATALSEIVMPRMADLHRDGERSAFRALVLRAMGAGAVVGVVALVGTLLLGEWLLGLLFGPEYVPFIGALVIMMASTIAQCASLYVGTAAQALQLFTVQVPINVALLVVLSVSAWVFVPQWGIDGAAGALALTNVVQLGLYLWLLRSRILPLGGAVRRA